MQTLISKFKIGQRLNNKFLAFFVLVWVWLIGGMGRGMTFNGVSWDVCLRTSEFQETVNKVFVLRNYYYNL